MSDWTYDAKDGGFVIDTETGEDIAAVCRGNVERGLLLASAPALKSQRDELLEALQLCVSRLDELCEQFDQAGTYAACYGRQVVARAKG